MGAPKTTSDGGRIKLRAAKLELSLLDSLRVDALATGVFSDEHPLQGTAGFADWRLNGRVSAQVQSGFFGCASGETLLLDTAGRIGARFVLVTGLGPREDFDLSAFREALRRLLVAARRACLDTLGVELPGVLSEVIPLEDAVVCLLELVENVHPAAELHVFCKDRKSIDLIAQIHAG